MSIPNQILAFTSYAYQNMLFPGSRIASNDAWDMGYKTYPNSVIGDQLLIEF